MPLNLFYTMVQKSQKWPKTQIRGGGGGSCLNPVSKCVTFRKKTANLRDAPLLVFNPLSTGQSKSFASNW